MRKIDLLINNGVNVDQGLELLGDMEMYEETLEDFLTESDERLSKLHEYKKILDMSNYAILVHAMKSDSKYLGFTKLAELSLQHEIESKVNNIKFINDNFDELMSEANRIVKLVRQYLEN